MYKNFGEFIRLNEDGLLEKWMEEMDQEPDMLIQEVVNDFVYRDTSKEFVALIVSNITDDQASFSERLDEFAEKVVHIGWPIQFVTAGLRNFGLLVYKLMHQEEKFKEPKDVAEETAFYQLQKWFLGIYNRIVNTYAETWEKTVSIQKEALQELSAPLLPIFENISVMPLIGTIDTERAKLIMENLLVGVVKNRSEVVLIDITGVPVVDTMVAHHIIQASEAVKLVGCQAMLVGIRPEIAQTIVNLGIDLDQIITTNTMKKGIERALALTNKEIVTKEG